MKKYVDLNTVTPITSMKGEDARETAELSELFERAKEYLSSFNWCDGIKDSYFGLGVGKIVGVYLFKILHTRSEVDDFVWIVVGDIPPAYITIDDAPNAACALDAYIGAMREWVSAVLSSAPVDELIPVNVPPTQKWARQLTSRLDFLDNRILVGYKDELDWPT